MLIQSTFFQILSSYPTVISVSLARHLLRWLVLFVAILCLSTAFFLRVHAQSAQATVISSGLNMRAGPGFNYNVIGNVVRGDALTVLGQSENCRWLLVRSAKDIEGWVSGKANYVTVNFACSAVAASTSTIAPLNDSNPTASQPNLTTVAPANAPTPTPFPTTAGNDSVGTDSAVTDAAATVPPGQGCYLVQNQIGPPVTVTFTHKDSGQSQQIPILRGEEVPVCLKAGKYTYTVSVVGYVDKNGEFTVAEGDAYYFPVRPTR